MAEFHAPLAEVDLCEVRQKAQRPALLGVIGVAERREHGQREEGERRAQADEAIAQEPRWC
jgi:hypothetical protein